MLSFFESMNSNVKVKFCIFEKMTNIKHLILSKIKSIVYTIDPNSEIILFGSQARGDERDDSDWDLMILTRQKTNLSHEQKFRHALFELELEFNISLSVFVKYKPEWETKYVATPLYKNILADGVTI